MNFLYISLQVLPVLLAGFCGRLSANIDINLRVLLVVFARFCGQLSANICIYGGMGYRAVAKIAAVWVFNPVVVFFRSVKARFYLKSHLRARRTLVVSRCSNRAGRILSILDDESLDDSCIDLIDRHQHIRCAVLLSRRARLGLKYPKYSAANEKIVCDWISKHCPESMTEGVKQRMMPLAIKLTFVPSIHEQEADLFASWAGIAKANY